MKKFFIILSTLIIGVFFTWKIVTEPDQYMSDQSDNVVLLEHKSRSKNVEERKQEVDQSLRDLARKNNSVIIKGIKIPSKTNKNEDSFLYQKYGQGSLTKGLKEASVEQQEASSVLAIYRVISGPLTTNQLINHFKKMGYRVIKDKPQSISMIVYRTFASPSLIMIFIVCILTFISLTVIIRIKNLRAAGIHLISGENFSSIMFSSIKSDALTIILAFSVTSAIGIITLWVKGLLQNSLWKILIGALGIYDGILLFLSVLLSLIYLFSLKRKNLMNVIKGKLPVGRLIGIMLFCQFLSIIVVGLGMNGAPVFYFRLQTTKSADHEWKRLSNYVHLETGLGTSNDSTEKHYWYQFLKDEIENHDAIVVQNNLASFGFENVNQVGISIDTYAPDGNAIYVSPSYLKLANIKLDSETLAKINNLKLGEFGFILPQKLKGDSHIKREFEKDLKYYTDEKIKPKLITAYVPNHKERFVFNKTPRVQQFVKDPIIVVLSPQGTGENVNSLNFWKSTVVGYSFYKDYDQTKQLLKKHHLYNKVAYIVNSKESYDEEVKKFERETIGFLAGSIFAIITSLLLFNSMNLLYFEEFRRDIFIKKVSGLKFFELHRKYLLIQFIIFVSGIGINIFLTHDAIASLITLLIFLVCMVLTLTQQMKKEDRFAVTVLKGM